MSNLPNYVKYQEKTAKIKNIKIFSLQLFIIIFSFLLFLRDVNGIDINKYIFIFLTIGACIALNTKENIYLLCFLLPLYVGLPGNFITIIIFLKIFILYIKKGFNLYLFLYSFLCSCYVVIQNVFMGNLSMFHMILAVEIMLVMIIVNNTDTRHYKKMIYMYIYGVTVLGIIMLLATLNVYDISELFLSTSRLGATATQYVENGIMRVSIDPNYYGYFTIAALSMGIPLYSKEKNNKEKLYLIVSLFVSICISLIGMSRTFVLILFIWIVLYLLSQNKLTTLIKSFIIFLLMFLLIKITVPGAIEGITERFNDNNISTGNGRSIVILEYWQIWKLQLEKILFGVGLFNCNVHCMPLQYLFGGGIVFSILLLQYSRNIYRCIKKNVSYLKLRTLIPFFVTLIFSLFVPVASSLTFMFPILVTTLYVGVIAE